MNKRLILIAAAAGLVSFAGAFVTGWLGWGPPTPNSALGTPSQTRHVAFGVPLSQPKAASAAAGPTPPGTAGPTRTPAALLAPTAPVTEDATGTRALTEQQLKELVREVREKIQEYDRKLQDLEKEKERMQTARQTLKKDIDTLNNLQVELAASTANLKNERDALLKTRIEIDQVEKSNLTALAAAYDKMDPARAGEIFKSMAQGQARNGAETPSANVDDAVKILRFMQERTKAKVLAEMATTEPALAAALSLKLKRVVEKK